MDAWHASLDLHVRAGEISKTTHTAYVRGAHKFIDWSRDAGLALASPETVLEWRAALLAKGYKIGTINAWYGGVRAFYTFASSYGLPNPCEGIKAEKRHGGHKRQPLTGEEVRRLLSTLSSDGPAAARDRAMICLMLYTGVRTVEVHRANLADLSTQGGQLVLGLQGKGRQEVDEVAVLAHPEARDALYSWLAERGHKAGPLFTSLSDRSAGRRLSLAAIRELIMAKFHAAGIAAEHKTVHSLRHTAISNYVKRSKGNVLGAKRLGRHASIETTMIYVHEVDRLTNPPEALIDYEED